MKEDPKSYINFLLDLVFFALAFLGASLYLVVMGKYALWIYATVAGGFMCLCFFLVVLIRMKVSALKTEQDWKSRAEAHLENQKFKLTTTQYELILKKLNRQEDLTPQEMKIYSDVSLEILDKNAGE